MEKKTVLVVMARGFEEIELTAPVDILRRLGVEVTVAGVGGIKIRGAHGIEMQADVVLQASLTASDFDAVMLPGGSAAWDLCTNETVLRILREMRTANKLLAAICAAPMVLAKAGVLLPEQKVTCYPMAEVQAAVAATATLTENPVDVSKNLITGRGPAVALEFGYAIGEALVGAPAVKRLRSEMCCVRA